MEFETSIHSEDSSLLRWAQGVTEEEASYEESVVDDEGEITDDDNDEKEEEESSEEEHSGKYLDYEQQLTHQEQLETSDEQAYIKKLNYLVGMTTYKNGKGIFIDMEDPHKGDKQNRCSAAEDSEKGEYFNGQVSPQEVERQTEHCSKEGSGGTDQRSMQEGTCSHQENVQETDEKNENIKTGEKKSGRKGESSSSRRILIAG